MNLLQMDVNHHDISKSGLYVLFMALCDPDASPVMLDGSVDSLDPCKYNLHCVAINYCFFSLDGYVPADLFGDLPFYLALSCMYTIIAVTWLILCYWFRYDGFLSSRLILPFCLETN